MSHACCLLGMRCALCCTAPCHVLLLALLVPLLCCCLFASRYTLHAAAWPWVLVVEQQEWSCSSRPCSPSVRRVHCAISWFEGAAGHLRHFTPSWVATLSYSPGCGHRRWSLLRLCCGTHLVRPPFSLVAAPSAPRSPVSCTAFPPPFLFAKAHYHGQPHWWAPDLPNPSQRTPHPSVVLHTALPTARRRRLAGAGRCRRPRHGLPCSHDGPQGQVCPACESWARLEASRPRPSASIVHHNFF
jgi:hypothetical protein